MGGKTTFNSNRATGFSLVDVMVGTTIFVISALVIVGVHQKLARDAAAVHLSDKTLEYMQCEVDRLKRLVRLPERNSAGNLVYRDAAGNVTVTGGSLVSYGYGTNLVSADDKLNAADQAVTYPDVLNAQSNTMASADRVNLKRKYSVQIFNGGKPDEYKQVTITLSDVKTPPRFNPLSETIILKKPDPRALDTRIANGTASLSGRVLDKLTNAAPSNPITVTLVAPAGTVPQSRMTVTDAAGNFYFAPPIDPLLPYTIQFQCAGFYYSKSFSASVKPGTNDVVGDSPGVVLLSPVVYAQASFTVKDGDTNALLPGVAVCVTHNGGAPSGPQYYIVPTDANGVANFNIQIPVPDALTYSQFYVSYLTLAQYHPINNPADQWLALNKNLPLNRTYNMFTLKKGSLLATVTTSAGMPNAKAQVFAYINPNYTGLMDQGLTDSSGQVTLSNLEINTPGSPQQTSRSFYLQVVSPTHLIYNLVTPPIVTVNANQQTSVSIPMQAHQLKWGNSTTAVGVNVGYSTNLSAKAFYEGHQGPTVNDALRGPNPSAFPSVPPQQMVTAGGKPATFTWSGWDPSIVNVVDTANADTKTLVGVSVGNTQINVAVTYSFSWNGTPYTLSANRTYNVSCLVSGSLLTLNLTPTTLMMNPSSQRTFLANASTTPLDLIYSWSVTGSGAASFTPVNSNGNPVPNDSVLATRCLVTAASALGSQFTVNVNASSASNGQSASASRAVTVDYTALSASINPSGPVNTQPASPFTLRAVPLGGSGSYSYSWILLNPNTGDPDTTIGSLSNTSTIQTTFTGLQIGSVNAALHIVDTQSGRFVDQATLINVQPSGGVTQ